MRELLVCVLLLCVLCAGAQAQGDVKSIKLCGREFIRAIVYTCGGSRWRRLLRERELPGLGSEDQNDFGVLSNGPGTELARRDINQMLTTMCCQVGCSKKDLTFLC
ncbi:insulin-like 5a [Megalops cyprinoides]|uniref:insulin-like 5a n=1 Tax=Megalops cyprinoides TaxID=118141 RepID=UPI001863F2D8|nr:insulin-like 5a [Megalops cyprinoides]